jgi:oligopeptidase B
MAKERTIKPPMAKKVPRELVAHGDKRVDEYYWMRDRKDPDVAKYVDQENQYTDVMTRHLKPLQEKILKELADKIVITDSSVPVKIDDYFYYSRTEKDKQHAILCRRKGSVDTPEEIILDMNKAAEGRDFFNCDVFQVSPDHNLLAYLVDLDGSERHELFVKDLRTGEHLPDKISNIASIVWANDNKTLFYSTMDYDFRPFKVLRHVLGTDPKTDVVVSHEKDRAFNYADLAKTKTKQYILITSLSSTTTEVRYLKADKPSGRFKTIRPREHGIEYFVFHHGDRFFIVTNEIAPNFKIVTAPVADPSPQNWKEFMPHSEDVMIDVSHPYAYLDVYKDWVVVYQHEDALPRIHVISLKDGAAHDVELPEKLSFAIPEPTFDFDADVMRFNFSSLITPDSVYDYNMATKTLELRKKLDVPGYDPSQYVSERIFAKASDGTKIPVVVLHKKGIEKNGRNPTYLYSYGAYGDYWGGAPTFNARILPLLDRGFVCAKGQIRGGGYFGKKWHKGGSMLTKINTFSDFIACAEKLIEDKYTSPDRLVVRGRSAGGLLMGAVLNMRPDLFRIVVAEVPFVDAITTMLDPTIPLTVSEFEEWGDPSIQEFYEYFKKYSPYDNVIAKEYPNVLVSTAMNDSRVQYFEPLKWVAKLRATKTDKNMLLLRVKSVEGHSGAPGKLDYLKWYGFMYAFILDRFGISE